ncbi:MAG: tRNA (adenosine(37)-N6)-dimethylallyltransferase [Gemmatimonadales bacterium]
MAARKIRVIVGPTAAGKSSRVMEAAESVDIAVISADSRQIYRGFDIGTAKPSREDRARVVHFGVDIVDPTEHYSAYRWARDAARWIGEAERLGKVPVIVGGTGFYIKSLFDPPYDDPPVTELAITPEYEIVDPGPDLRNHIETRVDQMLRDGWLAEVERLMESVPRDAIAWKASGYRVMRAHLEGEYSLDHARERAIIDTRQYAKRQRTWFRHQLS